MLGDRRTTAAIAVAALCIVTGLVAAPSYGLSTTLPAALATGSALGVVTAGLRARGLLPVVTGIAGSASLAATAWLATGGAHYVTADTAVTGWAIAESVSLLVLVVMTTRWSPLTGIAAAGPAGLAVPAWLLRFGFGSLTVATVGGYAAWSFLTLVAAATGTYLRSLDARRTRAVAEARRDQQLQIARDLHDFVAHDVSGMLAQAQAGQLIARDEPAAALAAFQRIETAGHQALASMDRTVHTLFDEHVPADRVASASSLTALREHVERFAGTDGARTRLLIDEALTEEHSPPGVDLPREVVSVAHRIVVEALTNVRRHSPSTGEVSVRVELVGEGSESTAVITVDNAEPGTPSRARRRGGHGLPGLSRCVTALGGSFEAGATKDGGWRVQARLPCGTGPTPR